MGEEKKLSLVGAHSDEDHAAKSDLEERVFIDAATMQEYTVLVPKGSAPKPYEKREGEDAAFVVWRARHEETQFKMVQTAIVITNDEFLLPARLTAFIANCEQVQRDDPNFARVDALRELAVAIETLQQKSARLSEVLRTHRTGDVKEPG